MKILADLNGVLLRRASTKGLVSTETSLLVTDVLVVDMPEQDILATFKADMIKTWKFDEAMAEELAKGELKQLSKVASWFDVGDTLQSKGQQLIKESK